LTRYDEFLEMQAQETDDCILWPYSQDGRGYGQMRSKGRVRKVYRASCEMAHGQPTTPNHEVAHSCRNRSCFNPRHLRWATRAENASDRLKDGTAPRGENCGTAKLTTYLVREMRIYARSGVQQKELAAYYDVSEPTVSQIVNRQSWEWLV